MEGDVSSGGSEGSGGDDVVEADGQVEGRLAERHVAAVEHGGDFFRESLVSEGIGLCDDSGRVRNSGK